MGICCVKGVRKAHRPWNNALEVRVKQYQLICLLHDASECYIADIPRPVKNRLPDYLEI